VAPDKVNKSIMSEINGGLAGSFTINAPEACLAVYGALATQSAARGGRLFTALLS